jgi:hypothetical protein
MQKSRYLIYSFFGTLLLLIILFEYSSRNPSLLLSWYDRLISEERFCLSGECYDVPNGHWLTVNDNVGSVRLAYLKEGFYIYWNVQFVPIFNSDNLTELQSNKYSNIGLSVWGFKDSKLGPIVYSADLGLVFYIPEGHLYDAELIRAIYDISGK